MTTDLNHDHRPRPTMTTNDDQRPTTRRPTTLRPAAASWQGSSGGGRGGGGAKGRGGRGRGGGGRGGGRGAVGISDGGAQRLRDLGEGRAEGGSICEGRP